MVVESTNLLLAAQRIFASVAEAERVWLRTPANFPGRAYATEMMALHKQLARARTEQAADFLPFFAANDEPDVWVG